MKSRIQKLNQMLKKKQVTIKLDLESLKLIKEGGSTYWDIFEIRLIQPEDKIFLNKLKKVVSELKEK